MSAVLVLIVKGASVSRPLNHFFVIALTYCRPRPLPLWCQARCWYGTIPPENTSVTNSSMQMAEKPVFRFRGAMLFGCLALVLALLANLRYPLESSGLPYAYAPSQPKANCYPSRPLLPHLQEVPAYVKDANRSDLSAMAQNVFFSNDKYNRYGSLQELKAAGAPQNTVHINNTLWICLTPKTGCTGWLYFVLYFNDGILISKESAKRHPGQIHNLKYRGPMTIAYMKHDEREKIRRFSEYPHFLIARNPYVRFVSSWSMWKAEDTDGRVNVSLDEFFETIVKPKKWRLLDHVEPISENCRVNRPLNYTVLRVEEEALWFDGFVEKYGMAKKLKQYTDGGGPVLFQSGLHDASNFTQLIGAMTGTEMWPAGLFESKHHRGSAKKFTQYYTKELAAKVTSYFLEDFVNFQYPLWDGDPDSFRFV